MQPGYIIEEYGILNSSIVWVYNWRNINKVGLAHFNHDHYAPGGDKHVVAIFKIKPKN